MRPSLTRLLLILFCCASLFSIVYCGSDQTSKVESDPDKSPYLNHGDSARYVGMDKCMLCHQDIYESFLQTGMGQSFAKADKKKSAGKFDKHSTIYDKNSDFYYKPYFDAEGMKILEFRLEKGDTTYKRIEKVDYIIGSGQHTNSHIQNVNGYLNQMPMTFYTQSARWDLPPGFEDGHNTRFSRKIGLECMSCHNALPGHVQGSENKYDAIPSGINCERCHGPGSIHVAQRSTGSVIDTSRYIDYSIVNPGKLSIEKQFDVCQRCHLQGNTVLAPGKSFFDFRPGMKLSDYMTTFLPRYEGGDDEFIMASHADRLKQSPCFIQTSGKINSESKANSSLRPYKNALTCVTCHDPHVSVKRTDSNVFNAACSNCHSSAKKTTVCSESPAVRAESGDNCVSCHMPRSGSIDIPHVTVHDHYIRKPVKTAEIVKIKKFIGLSAVNDKNPSSLTRARAYLQQYERFEYNSIYLDSAAVLIPSNTIASISANLELLVHLEFMRGDLKKIVSYVERLGPEAVLNTDLRNTSRDNANAWTLYRIGEAYGSQGNLQQAEKFLRRADQLAPFNPEFKNKLGVNLLSQNKTREGISMLEETIRENPKFVQALNNLGYANLVNGNPAKAEELYLRALALDPDYIPLLLNAAGYYAYRNDFPQARKYLQRVLKKDPSHAQAKELLSRLNAAAKR